jgi:hypothetical protein
MAARAPKADTYSMSGNQAVLSAGISKADMDFLVRRAQERGTDRAKIVREIMTEWRMREQALDAAEALLTGRNADGEAVTLADLLRDGGELVEGDRVTAMVLPMSDARALTLGVDPTTAVLATPSEDDPSD